MRVFDFKPSKKNVGEEEVEIFTGVIKVKIPPKSGRLQMLKETGFKLNSNGELDQSVDLIDQSSRILEIVKTNLVSCDITRIEDGFKFNNLEDMEYDNEASDMLLEVGNFILQGPRLGK